MHQNPKKFTSIFFLIILLSSLVKNGCKGAYMKNSVMKTSSDTIILNILNELEYRLEKNILKENDLYVLAYLIKIIDGRRKYLGVDERPDYWYLRQGR